MTSRLQNFLDENGRVTQWPSKRIVQLEVVEYIASHFPDGSQYSEGQLNEEIKICTRLETGLLYVARCVT